MGRAGDADLERLRHIGLCADPVHLLGDLQAATPEKQQPHNDEYHDQYERQPNGYPRPPFLQETNQSRILVRWWRWRWWRWWIWFHGLARDPELLLKVRVLIPTRIHHQLDQVGDVTLVLAPIDHISNPGVECVVVREHLLNKVADLRIVPDQCDQRFLVEGLHKLLAESSQVVFLRVVGHLLIPSMPFQDWRTWTDEVLRCILQKRKAHPLRGMGCCPTPSSP